jgi:hypothetical protein
LGRKIHAKSAKDLDAFALMSSPGYIHWAISLVLLIEGACKIRFLGHNIPYEAK